MTLRLGDTAPDFEQESSIGKIRFHEWAGDSWVVLFSHPADFTPVCTTELGLTAKLKPEFDKRNVKAIALSVDPADKHRDWIKDIEETQQTVVGFPIIADADKSVSNLYDMIHPEASATATVRSLFIIDPAKKVRLIITYPDEHRPQLRRSAARARRPTTDRRLHSGDAGQLEGWRRRHHPADRAGSCHHRAEISEGLYLAASLPAPDATAEQVSSTS